MAKKVNTKESVVKEPLTEADNNVTVLVNVIRNFKDATDNNRVISSGPNSYYRTNKDRADKLVAAGFCKYEDEELEVAKAEVVEDPDTPDAEEDKPTDTEVTDPSDAEEDKPTDTETTDSSKTEETNASDDSNPNE